MMAERETDGEATSAKSHEGLQSEAVKGEKSIAERSRSSTSVRTRSFNGAIRYSTGLRTSSVPPSADT